VLGIVADKVVVVVIVIVVVVIVVVVVVVITSNFLLEEFLPLKVTVSELEWFKSFANIIKDNWPKISGIE
jgi:hypothetical protein